MENIQNHRQEIKFLAALTAFTVGSIALIYSCVPSPREPNEEQRHNPQFIECVDYRKAHDEFKPAPGPQGIYVGPTREELAMRHCMDDIFPL